MRKVLSAFFCVFLLLTAAACAETPEPQLRDPYEEQKALYEDIISQYSALLSAKQNGEELPEPDTSAMNERETAIAEVLYGIVSSVKDAESAKALGYGFKDADGNGTPELFLLSRAISLKAIFTLSDGVPILLEAKYGENARLYFAKGGRFFTVDSTLDSENVEEAISSTCHVEGDKMVYDVVYGVRYDRNNKKYLGYFRIENSERTPIDEDTFTDLYREPSEATEMYYGFVSKLEAPRVLLPLADEVSSEDLPVADFSSYAAIRETYQAIAGCLEDFHYFDWIAGEYDNLFAFPTDRSFEYYTRLLYATHDGNYFPGYDEIDLSGDGKDELVFLDEDYRIKAIFTEKDGSPVLVASFAGEVAWLDEEGFLHVDREEPIEAEYSVYAFAKDASCRFVYSFLVDDNGYRYLTRDGKTERISFEKSLEVYYDDYCRYPESFETNQQTRNVSALTYTPLEERPSDLTETAVGKHWIKTARLDKTTGKAGALCSTHLQFENVTNAEMQLHILYWFSFLYPDPDREDELIQNITEEELTLTLRKKDGEWRFDEGGLKGRIEFGEKILWLVVEESTDSRFPVGHHLYEDFAEVGVIT